MLWDHWDSIVSKQSTARKSAERFPNVQRCKARFILIIFMVSLLQYSRIMKTLYKWSYPCVDLVIVSSSMMKKEFLSFCNIKKENIKIMMNPVDSDYLRSKADDRILFNNKGLRYMLAFVLATACVKLFFT